jgi:hypothetical protein
MHKNFMAITAVESVGFFLVPRIGVKPKTIKLVFVAALLSTQHSGEREKTGWL